LGRGFLFLGCQLQITIMKKDIWIALLGTVIMIIVMRVQGSSLTTDLSPRGILDLEFADTTDRLVELVAGLDLSVIRINIWLDFVFIFFYTWFLSLAGRRIALRWGPRNEFRRTGFFLAKAAFVAGVFDVMENILMLKSIAGDYSAFSLQATFYCAWIKFMILLFILLYIMISLPRIIRKKS
jgi:putative Mn2+ efflux pump MntP